VKALGAMVAVGMGSLGRRTLDQATRYQGYLVTARTCGVSEERAKAIFAEEMSRPVGFDRVLLAATWRVTSGEEAST
jgi:hypothetical protein